MNWYSNNIEFWEIPELGFQVLIRKQREWNYRIFLVNLDFNIEKNINTVKDDIPFLGFQIEQWEVSFWWMFVPTQYRQKWIPDIFLKILENISKELWSKFWITKYINKPILAKKLLDYGFTPLQDDIKVEICEFWEIPTIKFVRWNVYEVISKVDLSWKIHPPFYSVNQQNQWTWIIVPIHTRFSPPIKDLIFRNSSLVSIHLNYKQVSHIL